MDYKEIEYKYWANSFTKEELFSRIEEVVLENESLETPETIYVVSCDDYYIRNADE
jgi:hypothetical protein